MPQPAPCRTIVAHGTVEGERSETGDGPIILGVSATTHAYVTEARAWTKLSKRAGALRPIFDDEENRAPILLIQEAILARCQLAEWQRAGAEAV